MSLCGRWRPVGLREFPHKEPYTPLPFDAHCCLSPYGYSYKKASCVRPGKAVICNFSHPDTMTLSRERQSARMSKITNDSLTRSDTRCFFIAVPIWQQATVGVNGLNLWSRELHYVCDVWVTAAGDLWPGAGGEGGDAAVPGDGGQPINAAPLPHRGLLLHTDVHRVQCAASRQVPQVYAPQTSLPLGRGTFNTIPDPSVNSDNNAGNF